MNKENILVEKATTIETKVDTRPKAKSAQVERSAQIKEAVARSVREYGETLKKLAKDD